MSLLLSIHDATIGYQGVPILSGVTLEISEGESLAVLGPNGSGKTTLLKTLAGILPLLEGESHFMTQNENMRIGYVPQRTSLSLLLPLTVQEVVEMGTYGTLKPWQGVGKTERSLVEWALEAVGMSNSRKELYSNLSGGQQQRVLIARSLATNPALLVLDEPLASLDHSSMETLIALFQTLRDEKHVAFLWADHMMPALQGIVREAIAIHGNTIVRGPLEEMIKQDWSKPPKEYLGIRP